MAQMIDPQVGAILDRSCQDCHSSRTTWPWYSRVAPISWTVAGDVNDGRQQLNFSEWPRDDTDRIQKRLKKIARDVQEGEMPPGKYTWLHPQARLTEEQRAQLVKWATQERERLGAQK